MTNNITFDKPLDPIDFGIMYKILPSKGNMAWEYNPFRNYRLSEAKYYFRGKFFSKEELEKELGKSILDGAKDWSEYKYPKLSNGIQSYEDDPIFYDKNQLIDFDTDELSFDINHPIDILPQWSYDGSVNLIINDGKNIPRLINSRFSPLGKGKYQIVDRKGNNDTNIYDQGAQFDSDTSLYKTYVGIPKIEFINVYQSGNLPVGNYHFYFRYVDADGNETDFVGESGMVSIFKGTQFGSITSGFRDENSYKSVKFLISDIDPAYQYINVYYTRSSSDINENAVVQAYKIDQKFLVNNSLICQVFITGNEQKTEITVDEINPQYQIAQNVQTQESCQNRLFFGNVQNQNIDYTELSDLSLRFTARANTKQSYDPGTHDYNTASRNTYIDPLFIYNFTGYQNHEIYRFGIVYILNNGTLSPVFNIRGMYFNENDTEYTEFPILQKNGDKQSRLYISSNENTGIIYKNGTDASTEATESLENIYGVLRIETGLNQEISNVIGIQIDIQDKDILFQELRKHNIKGYFFVRQKRIPLRLCQAFTIGVDGESNTPLLYTDSNTVVNSKSKTNDLKDFYIAERFLSDDKRLVHNLEDRLYCVPKTNVYKYGAICPEYDINSPYYNTLFCGDEYIVEQASASTPLQQDETETRHFYVEGVKEIEKPTTFTTRIVGVEDNVKLVEVGNKMFSARAGEAEEAFRYEYINSEIKSTDSSNLIRGSFGPYIAFDGYKYPGTLVNIYIKDYQTMNKQELFKIRYSDKSPYYAISNRYDIEEDNNEFLLYRGDTYICTFTHRLNRNFQDPSAPTNHKIVDEDCWKDNYEVSDGVVKTENFDKINLGDVNAVKIGTWVTFQLVSSSNLNIRALDDSIVDEVSLTGHARAFYPYSGMSADGSYKIPEALCYNKGFNKSLSERHNFEVPDVPAIKNDFTNRISYSDIHVNDAFKNGYRTFRGTHYRDYPKTYGQITKLIELRGNLLCVFEHGVALIPVNERAVAGEGAGGNIYINTSNVLPENPKIISDTFGSQWKDSIIKTPTGIYGVDTVGKKIWRTNGENFECISDFKVQEFLNKNITLTEREIDPIIGIRNVKTHYNKFKHDVMFTFYDNLYGFEEKVWNLCYNELLQKWITFYSWVPSYSENIYNQYFSFDRNTSKWISKLGVSHIGNDFSDGVVLTNNIIPNEAKSGYRIGELSLANRTLPEGEGISVFTYYTLDRDNLKNFNYFDIKYQKYQIVNNKKSYIGDYVTLEKMLQDSDKNYDSILVLETDATNLCSELFIRGTKTGNSYNKIITNPSQQKSEWIKNCINSNVYCICKDNLGRRMNLDQNMQYNASNIVTLLNIKANILVTYEGQVPSLSEAYTSGFQNGTQINAGYYQSVVAVIPQYNMQFLTTDFWKHGQAGIIDISDTINPCYWYGKQHPFEFEFIVADNPQAHKIFDNLAIISNNAEPESFHYEIIGDCFNFSKDKKNMYIRQEATKELYQYNGSDITFDSDYSKLTSEHRKNYVMKNGKKQELDSYDRSTLLPLYYQRQSTINEIEDSYHLKNEGENKDFSALAGGEITHYKTLDEYRIWNHAKAVDITDPEKGRLRGNMHYREDEWYVQINPLNIVEKNEKQWEDLDGQNTDKIPVELGQNPIPSEVLKKDELEIPQTDSFKNRGYTTWDWNESQNQEVKMKDKWIKIRVRYTGNKLSIISAVRTMYSLSYS